MDTYEARRQMRDLAQDTLDLLDEVADGETSRSDGHAELRKMELEARTLLTDAGYPGESAWRGLQMAVQALSRPDEDGTQLADISQSLRNAVETLDSLTAVATERDSDFRIIG